MSRHFPGFLDDGGRGFRGSLRAHFDHRQVKLGHVLPHHPVGGVLRGESVHTGSHPLEPGFREAILVDVVETGNHVLLKQ